MAKTTLELAKETSPRWGIGTWVKILGMTVLLFGLLSISYTGLALSGSVSSSPIAQLLAAFMDTMVLGYFVMYSRFQGRKEWLSVFLVLYIGNYVLTAMESLYLTSLLTENVVVGLLVNGAVTSGIFAFALVQLLGERRTRSEVVRDRLAMPAKEWIWKTVGSGAIYLALFILFGFVVYGPLGGFLDAPALASEQASVSVSAAGLVLPLEAIRGVVWATLATIAAVSLPFGWRKTGLIAGLLLAVPLSFSIFMSSAIVPGLQIAHFAELFGENLVFGVIAVWVIHLRSRLAIVAAEPDSASSVVAIPVPA